MIALSLYEITENKNYKVFIPLFVIGFSLGIMIHLSLTIYIAIFSAIYLLLNVKKFFNKQNLIIFTISCIFILMISACFYIPVLVAQSDINLSGMKRDVYWSTLNYFSSLSLYFYLFISMILVLIVFIIYIIKFILNRKINTDSDKKLVIISIILIFIISPLNFTWKFLSETFLGMIQFAWRLYLIYALLMVFQLNYIIKRIRINLFRKSLYVIVCFIPVFSLLFYGICYSGYSLNDFNDRVNRLSTNYGIGSLKSGDYFPIGATKEYVFSRANQFMILDSNTNITEFANYQSLNQINFIVYETDNNYVVLNIPYEICEGLKIYQYESVISFNNYELELCSTEINEVEYLMIYFEDSDTESKITLDYNNCIALKNYLQENPFEFIVLSGDENANFTDFIKKNSHTYSVEINVSGLTSIELPTFCYTGYEAKYVTENGEYMLNVSRSENGLLQVEVSESGVLYIEFKGTYIKAANAISITGISLFVIFEVIYIFFDKKKIFSFFVTKCEVIEQS